MVIRFDRGAYHFDHPGARGWHRKGLSAYRKWRPQCTEKVDPAEGLVFVSWGLISMSSSGISRVERGDNPRVVEAANISDSALPIRRSRNHKTVAARAANINNINRSECPPFLRPFIVLRDNRSFHPGLPLTLGQNNGLPKPHQKKTRKQSNHKRGAITTTNSSRSCGASARSHLPSTLSLT